MDVFGWMRSLSGMEFRALTVACLGALTLSATARPVDGTGISLSKSFISTGETLTGETGKCVVFRKVFELGSTPSAATIHLFADARYVLWVNGSYVERGPGRFEPDAPEYDSVDVARFLRKGQNAISILVVGQVSNGKIRWRPLGLTAQVLVGKGKPVTTTDGSWRWNGQTRYRSILTDWADMYDIADARVEDGDWTQTSYDDSKWQAAVPVNGNQASIHASSKVDDRVVNLKIDPVSSTGTWWGSLSARRIPPLKEHVVTPKWNDGTSFPADLTTGQGVGFKFGHLVLAYTRLILDADAGSEVELTYSPGTHYTCKQGLQEFVTSDTHSIFEGAIRVKSGRVSVKSVEFVERLYPFQVVGSFKSSDPLLDKLWTTCVRGLEVTSEDAYIDCTDRERVEWMDCDPPVFDVTRVAMAGPSSDGKPLYSDPRLLEEMLKRTAYTLQPEGWVKAHTCSDRFDIHAKMEDRACDWVEGARRYYESTGKLDVIREIWPAIVSQMNYFLDRRSSRGLVLGREWAVWGNPVGYQTCEGTALNAFICRALIDATFLGLKIGKHEDSQRFKVASTKLALAINTVLWDAKSGSYFGGYYDLDVAKKAVDYRQIPVSVNDHLIEPTLHAALFMLDQGLVPAERQASVSRYLLAHPPKNNDIMQYYYFFKQQYLADDAAQDLGVLDTLRREWKDMAESPYEATFEGLHSWGSSAHCYGLFPAYFLSSYVLGVRRDGPVGEHRLLIEPRLADLSEASGTVVTEFGPVEVSWKKDAKGGEFHLTVPAGVQATLRLPQGGGVPILDGVLLTRYRAVGRWIETVIGSGKHTGHW
jgi:hypothetical protein